MDFKEWIIEESSLNDLYQSAVDAFPNCRKRQHSIDEITITRLEWVPYRGMRTLFIKGLAQNTSNGHEYSPVVVFKGVQYHNEGEGNLVEIIDNNGVRHFFEKLSNQDTQILTKCTCKDYEWRFRHKNFEDHSHQGRDRTPYVALFNPGIADIAPGLCKHIMKLAHVLSESGITG